MTAREILKDIGYSKEVLNKMNDEECETELHDIYSCE